ncbi:conserved hypothetical protein [Sphingomonas aurantiaca]|jgi:hypothetical protein|uniref:Uncharacterized protein n=2 Tax=Sphingomonas aurantiaca TaxID=185949 RepID=A0A5E8AK64_9SPHN|nr:conserved hypothetical protein [Sphingomonas aurantiaca]
MSEGSVMNRNPLVTVDHHWWRRQTAEIIAVRSDRSSRRWRQKLIDWSGVPWDGMSELAIGYDSLAGKTIRELVVQLKLEIDRSGLPQVTVPTSGGVRVARAGLAEVQILTVDFDLIDFILPIAFETSAIAGSPGSLAPAVDSAIEHVRAAIRDRTAIARREGALRKAVEHASARIGEGCLPLWLRMDAVLGTEQSGRYTSRLYKMATMLLDDSLSSSPSPVEPIWTVVDVRDHVRVHRRAQRRRAAALLAHRTAGSIGAITEVSLALIRAAQLEPIATLRAAHAARLNHDGGDLRFRKWNCLNILTWIEGVLRTSIEFEQGRYDDGELILTGDYPASVALACKGRPIAAILDHPAFQAISARITSVEIMEDTLSLYHKNKVVLFGH